jgi:hypothetical protein
MATALHSQRLEKETMEANKIQKSRRRSRFLVFLLVIFMVIFTQAPPTRTFLQDAREHLLQWGVEKAVDAATRHLQKRARFSKEA